jgi:hypothetical protein
MTIQNATKGNHVIYGDIWQFHDECGAIGQSYLPWPRSLMQPSKEFRLAANTNEMDKIERLANQGLAEMMEPAQPVIIWPDSPK